ncbi:MAG: hypothetical protein KGH50_00985 [Candidatus Micrarchaeota archaeon]|nr:hypothetical protein [Candidatus Micrarchaeota archaeon]
MEYLMTYGWAIIAIAIVMVSLYSLGIFNLQSLAPTATPGSCQVIRTAAQTSLAGQCGNLIPRYVSQDIGLSSTSVADSPALQFSGTSPFTIIFWIDIKSYNSAYIRQLDHDPTDGNGREGWLVYTEKNAHTECLQRFLSGSADTICTSAPSLNKWYFVAFTYDGSTMKSYLNNTLSQSVSSTKSLTTTTQNLYIGGYGGNNDGQYLHSNIQLYNTSLDNTTLKMLYQEGIGGAPIDLQHLIGWWPLNGNTNDYSGNFRNGASSTLKWSANWQGDYSQPAT